MESLPEPDKKNDGKRNFDAIINSPEMQEQIRSQIKEKHIKPIFDNLIDQLKLDDMDIDAFLNLLVDYTMIRALEGNKQQQSDKHRYLAIEGKMQKKEAEMDVVIKGFLGEKNTKNIKNIKNQNRSDMLVIILMKNYH